MTEINDCLGQFDESIKRRFQESVSNSPIDAGYNNLITNRKQLAHGNGTNMTLPEYHDALSKALDLLDKLKVALNS